MSKILIVEDDSDSALALSIRLRAAGHLTLQVGEGAAVLPMIKRENPDIIVLDLGLPAGDGYDVLERLQLAHLPKRLPVIVLSARDARVHRERALSAGAQAFFEKPVLPETLLASISSLLASNRGQRAKKVLLIEDDGDTQLGLQIRLKARGYEVASAMDAVNAMTVAVREKPAAILLDLGLPGGGGEHVLERLKASPELSEVPVIILSARDDSSWRQRCLAAGAVAYFTKPADDGELFGLLNQVMQ